jgi:hypothetical protein
MVYSLVGYFVVFYRNGFSPSDLQKAQTLGGNETQSPLLCDTDLPVLIIII